MPTVVPLTRTGAPLVAPNGNCTPSIRSKNNVSSAEVRLVIAMSRNPEVNGSASGSMTSASPPASSATAAPASVNVTTSPSRPANCGVSFVAITTTSRVATPLIRGPDWTITVTARELVVGESELFT